MFGSENFVSLISFVKTSGATSTLLPSVSDYLVWYGKERDKRDRAVHGRKPVAAPRAVNRRQPFFDWSAQPIGEGSWLSLRQILEVVQILVASGGALVGLEIRE